MTKQIGGVFLTIPTVDKITMKKSLFYHTLVIILACSACNTIEEKGVTYTLIRDNLYSDENDNLYLKSVNNEDLKNKATHNVWLHTLYCDTCGTSRGKNIKN